LQLCIVAHSILVKVLKSFVMMKCVFSIHYHPRMFQQHCGYSWARRCRSYHQNSYNKTVAATLPCWNYDSRRFLGLIWYGVWNVTMYFVFYNINWIFSKEQMLQTKQIGWRGLGAPWQHYLYNKNTVSTTKKHAEQCPTLTLFIFN